MFRACDWLCFVVQMPYGGVHLFLVCKANCEFSCIHLQLQDTATSLITGDHISPLRTSGHSILYTKQKKNKLFVCLIRGAFGRTQGHYGHTYRMDQSSKFDGGDC